MPNRTIDTTEVISKKVKIFKDNLIFEMKDKYPNIYI